MSNFQPFRDRVLVRPFDEQEGTIKVPDSDRAKPDHGIIVAVGLGGLTDHGEIIPMTFKPDDHVYFGKYAGTEIEIDGEKLRIMSEAEILGEVPTGGIDLRGVSQLFGVRLEDLIALWIRVGKHAGDLEISPDATIASACQLIDRLTGALDG